MFIYHYWKNSHKMYIYIDYGNSTLKLLDTLLDTHQETNMNYE